MAEYIKREDAIELFWPVDPENDGSDGCTVGLKCGHYNSNEIETMLSDLPAAEVAEVRHGRWVSPHWRNSDFACNCSVCGGEAMHREYRWHERSIYPICPNCGARMDKEADHEVSE